MRSLHARTMVAVDQARSLSGLLLGLLFTCLTLASAHAQPAESHERTDLEVETLAKGLEERIVAPCCWSQTLEIHESPVVSELKQEIRIRLRAGESSESIENAMAVRYGERVRALPKGKDPRRIVSTSMLILLSASGLVVLALGLRWVRRGHRAEGRAPDEALTAAEDDELESQLLEELRRMDA